MNIFNGLKIYASLEKGEIDFAIWNKGEKFGLINKYHFLCLPCEYDHIELEYGIRGTQRQTLFAKMDKDGKKYTAIINGDAVCNILTCQPKSLTLNRQYLIIEEDFAKEGKTYTKYGLLNRGGIRILESEYDSIELLSDYYAVVSKDEYKYLYYICQTKSELRLGPSKEIQYGEGYNSVTDQKFYYATENEYDIDILALEGKEGFRQEYNWIFGPDDLDSDEEIRPRGYDKIYFAYHGSLNNFFAVVVDNKTELIDFNGDQIIPFVIPSEYRIETDTYNEGIVGVSKKEQEEGTGGETFEKTYYSYINSEGKMLCDFIYEEITKFKNGQAKACYSIYGKTSYGYCEQIIDKTGKILSEHTDWDSDGGNEWQDHWDMMDALDGEPDAYWNID